MVCKPGPARLPSLCITQEAQRPSGGGAIEKGGLFFDQGPEGGQLKGAIEENTVLLDK